MYKMIIVDDEPLIRSGLKNLIEWEVYGIEIIAEAENGTDAYLAIKSREPDIALIDITMPNLNGLDLIELCSHLKHCPKFIILSGYNNFEYVRTAMKYGAVNYLLKPVDQEELENTIMSTVRLLDDANTRSRQFQEGLLTLRNDILVRILTNRITNPELREKCRFVNLSFHCGNMYVGILHPLPQQETYPPEWTNFSAARSCEQVCAAYCSIYTAMDISDNLILIFKDYTNEMKEEDFKALLENCAKKISRQTGLTLISALGKSCSSISELHPSYSSCLLTVEHQEIMLNILQKDTLSEVVKDVPAAFDYEEFVQCLESQDREALKNLLHKYFSESVYKYGDEQIEGIKYDFIEFIIFTMQRLEASRLPNADIYSQKREAFQIIASSRSLKELEEKLFRFFRLLMDRLDEKADSSYSPLVQNALNYVLGNYQDSNLSLKTLAGQMNVNAAYLGRQFAMETNEYFTDYLNRLRISKAIHLLKTTSWKTAAIATSVGFSNISYFFTIFKKITGGRPGDYRKI